MPDYSLYARVIRPEELMEAAFGLAESREPMNEDEISEFIDKSERYTRAVLTLGTQLGVVIESENSYIVDSSNKSQIRKARQEERSLILKEYLLRYEPFITYISFLRKGYEKEDAASKINVLYELGLEKSKLCSQFDNLAEWTGVINEGEIEIEMNSLSEDYLRDLDEATESEASARLFLEYKLGQEIFAYMETEQIEEFVDALLNFKKIPRNSISSAGRAVEDFQRDIGEEFGTEGNYEEANGIVQMAQQMHREQWSLGRHLHGGKYLGGMRNPSGGHGYNPETLERWEVNSDVALEYILASLHYIRSTYMSAKENVQVL